MVDTTAHLFHTKHTRLEQAVRKYHRNGTEVLALEGGKEVVVVYEARITLETYGMLSISKSSHCARNPLMAKHLCPELFLG